MALPKTTVAFNFAQGLDTKTDPFQVEFGRFLTLQNSVFDKALRLTKRNGFGALAALEAGSRSTYLTTFNNDLIALGQFLSVYNPENANWHSLSEIAPLSLSTMPLLRNSLNQTQCDSTISPSGFVCTTYTEVNGTSTSYKYVIADSVTGQNFVFPQTLVGTAGAVTGPARVFFLSDFFILIFSVTIAAVEHLQYIAVKSDLSAVTTAVDITNAYTSSSSMSFDGVINNSALYLAWNKNVAGIGLVKINGTYGSIIITTTASPDPAHNATCISLCVDVTQTTNVIYIFYYNSAIPSGYFLAINPSFGSILAPILFTVVANIVNLATTAQNQFATLYYEVTGVYSYNSVPNNDLYVYSCSQIGGVIFAGAVLGLGIASKAFLISGNSYILGAYQSAYQPSYFLINFHDPQSLFTIPQAYFDARIAYENGGGYLTTGLPSVTVNGHNVSIPYLFKDLIAAVNKNINVASGTQVAGVYSQTGINLVKFTIATNQTATAEIANNLHFSGGFLWGYDGFLPTENNFFLYPDNVQATVYGAGFILETGHTHSNTVITNVGDTSLLTVGMTVTDASHGDIPANTTIVSFTSSTITLSQAATGTHSGSYLNFFGNMGATTYFYQVTYEWTDNQGNAFRSAPSVPVKAIVGAAGLVTLYIPNLRITYKNNVKIVIYRWGTNQQTYFQTTSIISPILSSTLSEFTIYTDINSDATIIGNNILYTTGGVLEDTGAPAFNAISLFNSRLFGIDSEDTNLLWYSKTVIEATPVEMSQEQTYYVPPTQGAQGSTGPMKCLAPMDDKLVIFKTTGMDYLTGQGPDSTGANSDFPLSPTFITSTVGSSNQNSIVFTPIGLMFEFGSEVGNQIWLLGRDLSTKYIGAPVEALTLNDTVLSAINVPGTNQVRFTMQSGIILMYDHYFGQWGTFTGIPGISSTLYQGKHAFINSSGAAFLETPATYLDGANPVLMSFTTAWIARGGIQDWQRTFWAFLLGTWLSPYKLSIGIAYDFNSTIVQDPIIVPGSQTVGQIEDWQINFKKQTCQSFQLTVTESYDATVGPAAGAGLTLSGINLVVGTKKTYPRNIPASRKIG